MNDLETYIAGFLSLDHPSLAVISEVEKTHPKAQPSVGLEVGKLLGLLIRLIQARRVLEFGTSLGYSTIWIAEALRTTGGRLTSVEYDPDLFTETSRNLSAAGLSQFVELVQGDARTVIEKVEGPFDLVLQDSDKSLYPLLLDRCIELTRDYGLIVADDALFKPKGVADRLSAPIHRYNEKVFADKRLYSTILPIGDGVTVSVKLRS